MTEDEAAKAYGDAATATASVSIGFLTATGSAEQFSFSVSGTDLSIPSSHPACWTNCMRALSSL